MLLGVGLAALGAICLVVYILTLRMEIDAAREETLGAREKAVTEACLREIETLRARERSVQRALRHMGTSQANLILDVVYDES